MLEIIAELYKYTPDYVLYRMTFAQAIAMIDTHNERQRREQEAAEEQSTDPDGYVDPSKYKVNTETAVDALPTLDDLQGAFGRMFA